MNLNSAGIAVVGYKIGVAKNHIKIRFPSMCRISRKWTFRAETIKTNPIVKIAWITISRGKAINAPPILTLKIRRKMNSMGRLKTKFTRLEKTVTEGRTCGGNRVLVMRSPPLIMESAPSKSEVENHTQGMSPQNKNTG
jgi:hypothetical protein